MICGVWIDRGRRDKEFRVTPGACDDPLIGVFALDLILSCLFVSNLYIFWRIEKIKVKYGLDFFHYYA